MDLGLNGKNVIITGGGSNIGRSIVHAFANEGANIVIAELSPEQGERVALEVSQSGISGDIKVISTDVTNPSSVESMVNETISLSLIHI